jgi:hypothetical protein
MNRVLTVHVLVAVFFLPIAAEADSIVLSPAPVISTAGANANDLLYTNDPGGFYDAVAKLTISTPLGDFGCSAALIGTFTLLTAAHCLDPAALSKDVGMDVGSINGITTMFLKGGTYSAGSWVFNPLFTPNDYFAGNDIGIITLSKPVVGLSPYPLYTGVGFGSIADLAGFGTSGTGDTGAVGAFGTFRHGENQFESTIVSGPSVLAGTSTSNIFLYDFDNGSASCNTLALYGQPSSVGVGDNEVMTTPGDSGGPSFINGQLAAIHSFDAIRAVPGCTTAGLPGGFGSFGGDTRISANLAFIEQNAEVPEPASLVLVGSALVMMPIVRFYRRRNATKGSSRAARRAGMKHATADTAMIRTDSRV